MLIRTAYEKVAARLQESISHIDALVKDPNSWFEEADTDNYHRWRDAAVTNSEKLQRWVNAERSWSMFIARTLCTKLPAESALLVDNFLFGSWHSEESSRTGNDAAENDASDAEQSGELEEEEDTAEHVIVHVHAGDWRQNEIPLDDSHDIEEW